MNVRTASPARLDDGKPRPRTGAMVDGKTEDDAIEEIGPVVEKDRSWIIRTASIAVFLGLWEYVGRNVDPLLLSYPTAIVSAAVYMASSGEIFMAVYESGKTLIIGFSLATIIGVTIGLFIGRYRTVEASTDWLVNALYATPLVAVVPLVTLWFGLGFAAKLFIVCLIAVFPILINTASGVRNVSASFIDVGTAFAASERQIFIKIILPASLPYMMTGLRLGIGRCIIGMVVAEFYTAVGGLGALIMKYGNQYDTAAMFVPILVLSLLGILLTMLVRRAEEYFAPWKAS